MPGERRVVRAEQRLRELVNDAGAAQLRERVRRGLVATIGQSGSVVTRAMVVCDDDVEPERTGLGDLLDGRDPAVHRHHQRHPSAGESHDRVARDTVPLLEPARQVPPDVGAELAQHSTASAVAQMPSTS